MFGTGGWHVGSMQPNWNPGRGNTVLPKGSSCSTKRAPVRRPRSWPATYRFLGLDDSFRPPNLTAAVNETKVKRGVEPGFERMLVELYEPDVVTLAARHPGIDLRLWTHFSHLASGPRPLRL